MALALAVKLCAFASVTVSDDDPTPAAPGVALALYPPAPPLAVWDRLRAAARRGPADRIAEAHARARAAIGAAVAAAARAARLGHTGRRVVAARRDRPGNRSRAARAAGVPGARA